MKFLALNKSNDNVMACKVKPCTTKGCTCHGGCSKNYSGPKQALY